MTEHLADALMLLVLPAVLPCIALVGLRPITLFIVPMAGAVLAALAAELEGLTAGTLINWYVVVIVAVNMAALMRIGWWCRSIRASHVRVLAGQEAGADRIPMLHWPSLWSVVTVTVVGAAALWPLQALRSPIIGYDAYAIWTLHSIFIYGGHSTFVSDLTNPTYFFSNPSYPPLIPASGALSFVAEGTVDLRLAAMVTTFLNACALATVGIAICSLIAPSSRLVVRGCALFAAASIVLIGFGLSGLGGVGGQADLLWAASVLAAIVSGLLLPRSTSNVLAAWLCATVGGLSKNEGFVTAAIVVLLIAARYVPLVKKGATEPARGFGRHGYEGLRWVVRVALVAFLMVLPEVLWYAFVQSQGIGSDFVGRSSQSLNLRFHATAVALWANLHVLPLAAAVAAVGALILLPTRRRMRIGNDLWLWAAVVGSLLAIGATYVFGALGIQGWLGASANRTTIFACLTLYCDMAIWLVLAASSRRFEVGAPRAPIGPLDEEKGLLPIDRLSQNEARATTQAAMRTGVPGGLA